MSALGLADYGSSDEEDGVVVPLAPMAATDQVNESAQSKDKGKAPLRDIQPDTTATIGPALGPAPGPAAMPDDLAHPLAELAEDDAQPPASPYTANRILLRNLTMPPMANFDIPPSPPGSPPPATTAKFTRFLELKTKGVHFNERLHQSSALRNPGLLAKLMDFAGISQEDQYATALPEAIAVPTKFPDWAYADKLVKEHERIARKKEEERAKMQREAIDFVPAKRGENDNKSGHGTPSTGRPSEKNGRPEAKRSRFDDSARSDSKRSRFDVQDRKGP